MHDLGTGILMLFGMVGVFANPPALLEQTESAISDLFPSK